MNTQVLLSLCIVIGQCYSLSLNRNKIKLYPETVFTTLPSVDTIDNFERIENKWFSLTNYNVPAKLNSQISNLEQTNEQYYNGDMKTLDLPTVAPEEILQPIVEKSNVGSEVTTESALLNFQDTNLNNIFQNYKKSKNANEDVSSSTTLPPVLPPSFFAQFSNKEDLIKTDNWDSKKLDDMMFNDDWNNYFCTEKYMDTKDMKANQKNMKKGTNLNNQKLSQNHNINNIVHNTNRIKRQSPGIREFGISKPMISEQLSDGMDLFGLDNLKGEEPLTAKDWSGRNPLPFDNSDVDRMPLTNLREMQSFTNSKNIHAVPVINFRDTKLSRDEVSHSKTLEMPKSLTKSIDVTSPSADFSKVITEPVLTKKSEEIKSSKNLKELIVPRSNFNRSEIRDEESFDSKDLKQTKENQHSEFLVKSKKESFQLKSPKEIPLSFLPNSNRVNLQLMSDSKKIESSTESNPFIDPIKIMFSSTESLEKVNFPITVDLPKMKNKKESNPMNKIQEQELFSSTTSRTQILSTNLRKTDSRTRSNNHRDSNEKERSLSRNSKRINSLPSTDYSKIEPPLLEHSRDKEITRKKVYNDNKTTLSLNSKRINGKRSASDDTEKSDQPKVKKTEKKEEGSWEIPDVKMESLPPSDSVEDTDNNSSENNLDDDSTENDYDFSGILAKGINNLLSFYLYVRRTKTGLAGILNRIFG